MLTLSAVWSTLLHLFHGKSLLNLWRWLFLLSSLASMTSCIARSTDSPWYHFLDHPLPIFLMATMNLNFFRPFPSRKYITAVWMTNRRAKLFDWEGPNHKSMQTTSSKIFKNWTLCGKKHQRTKDQKQCRRYGELWGGVSPPNGCLCPPPSLVYSSTVFGASRNETTHNDGKRNNYCMFKHNSSLTFSRFFA